MKILATIVLLYWLARAGKDTLGTWNKGYSLLWVIVSLALALGLLVPLYLIWVGA